MQSLEHAELITNKNDAGYPYRLMQQNFSHVSQAIIESLLIKKFLKNPKPGSRRPLFEHVESVGDAFIDDFIRDKQAGMALSSHIGPFELLAAYYAKIGVPVTVIGRDANYASFDLFLRDIRADYGVSTIWRNDKNSGLTLLSGTRSGRIIAALIDQDFHSRNQFAKFFGIEAAYPETPIKLAAYARVPIFSSFIVRIQAQHYRVISELIDYDPKDPEVVKNVLDVFSQRLEKLIVQYPDQWIWWHRRWRRRPNVAYDEKTIWPPSTKEYLQWLNIQ
ncbi:MAG: lysophospholipid acyltransferase family protein [Deltaproteobacteria bacterium]|nr:lysophospholipid acyltransferase family protein [Deltaproteobacteria bacterium]